MNYPASRDDLCSQLILQYRNMLKYHECSASFSYPVHPKISLNNAVRLGGVP